MTSADAQAEEKANELYWGSDMSVNQIAEELDLSKGTLYGMIRPRPAGLGCPSCGEEVVFPNRTARDRSTVACAVCGWEGTEEDAETYDAVGGIDLPAVEEDASDEERSGLPDRRRTLLGGAFLGAAVGLALVIWARRR